VGVGERVYKPIAVEVKGAVDRGLLQNFVEVANGVGYLPVLYFDPSMLPAYPEEASREYRPEASVHVVGDLVARLFDVVKPEKRHAVTLMILSNDQYKVVEGEISEWVESGAGGRLWVIDADEVLKEEKANFVKDLVENYSGCSGDAVEKIADAIVSQFADGYAVAAVLAADWLGRKECSSGEVERAVERARRDVRRFALDYTWHAIMGKDENVARWAAPLILATGFYGPHPPKLGEAVAVAMSHVVMEVFGAGSVERDDNVLKWLSQPLHGILYEAIEKVAYGAVYRRFGVGSDELCQGDRGEPCHLVEICTRILEKLSCEKCATVADVEEKYAKWVAKRFINDLIQNFLQLYDREVEDGRWRIRYETKGSEGVKVVEDVVDELDIAAALYGLAVLPEWYGRLKPLEGLFFVGRIKVGIVGLYLFPLLRERGRELVKKAVVIIREAERRGFYYNIDLWRAVGIAAAGRWEDATGEELEKAMRLATIALQRFTIFWPIVLRNVWPLLSETWRRIVSEEVREDGERRQRLADRLITVAYRVVKGYPLGLPLSLLPGIDKPDLEAVAKRFDALYNAASNAGKLRLLDMLLYTLKWDSDVAAVLLGDPQLTLWRALEEVVRRVEGFISHLKGVERVYAVAYLYPLLAVRYSSFGEFDKAVKYAKESLKALKELWDAYEKDKALTEEEWRPYLELKQIEPLSEEELNELSKHVYSHVATVYMDADKLDEAVKCAVMACESARKLGHEYDEVMSCDLLLRLKAVKGNAPPVGEFEELWRRASQAVGELGAVVIAVVLGDYVVALASVGRLNDVEKVLERWSWALELHPEASAPTYGVLSLFDGRYLEKAVGHLPEGARADLPRLADVLHDADEAGLFAEEPKIVMSAMVTLTVVYGRDVVEALFEIARSDKLFLSALVGLAYCKRGEEWGLKLARAAARAGSRFKGIGGRLFGELYMALEGVAVGKCITDEVLEAVYKLYYFHV